MSVSSDPSAAPVTTGTLASDAFIGDDLAQVVAAPPALLGGPPALDRPLPPWPLHDERERRYLLDVLDAGDWWRAADRQVTRLERDFAAAHGAPHALAVTNGTHALELALRTLGVGAGDEVIVPSLTFVATAMPVFSLGAVPVPVDVDRDTWCLDPAAVAAAATRRPLGVIPVHFAGQSADLDALLALCEERSWALVEDAAHAHGARWRDRPVGGVGDMAAFSFQNFKLMTAGEGGMLLFRDATTRRRAEVVANCGRPPDSRGYRHDLLGSNYRLGEFQAAVLNAQLERLGEQNRHRHEHGRRLDRRLAELPGVRAQAVDPRATLHARYMYVFTIDPEAFAGLSRDAVVDALEAEGVPARLMYPRIQDTGHFAPCLRRVGADPRNLPPCPASREIGERGIWLHHRALLGDASQVDRVAAALAKVQHHAAELAAAGSSP